MSNYSAEELDMAQQIIMSTIRKCEKMQPKFAEGTPQHTLLRNRIKALYISKSLTEAAGDICRYSKQELTEALEPVASIIRKCEKAQQKFAEGTPYYNRLLNMIKAMEISKSLILEYTRRTIPPRYKYG